MSQQLGLVADENGMLLFALIEMHDGFGYLAHEIAAVMRWLEIQLEGQLAEQIQSRSRRPVQIQDLIEVGIEAGAESAGRGGFAGAYFAGQQPGAMMIHQELETHLDLVPGLRSEQLLGIGIVAEGSFLEPEEGFYHGGSSSSFFFMSRSTKLMPVGSGSAALDGLADGNWPLTTGSTRRAVPSALPW